jgi:excisionase family DNA binding protein
MTRTIEPLFYTRRELAALFGVDHTRVLKVASENGIPVIRLSDRRVRIPRAAVNQWLEAQTQAAMK